MHAVIGAWQRNLRIGVFKQANLAFNVNTIYAKERPISRRDTVYAIIWSEDLLVAMEQLPNGDKVRTQIEEAFRDFRRNEAIRELNSLELSPSWVKVIGPWIVRYAMLSESRIITILEVKRGS